MELNVQETRQLANELASKFEFHLDGEFEPDGGVSFFSGNVLVKGWVIFPGPHSRLLAYISGKQVGSIYADHVRPDVLEVYSHLSSTTPTGFSTTIRFDASIFPEPSTLTLVMEDRGGALLTREYRLSLGRPRAEISLDEVTRRDGRILCEERNFQISGWVVGQDAVDRVTLQFDDGVVAPAHFGIVRPDVLIVHPDNPNGAAVGFACFIPFLPTSNRLLSIVVGFRGGAEYRQDYPVTIEAEQTAPSLFRRISFAERSLLQREGAARDPAAGPCFVVFSEANDEPAAHARTLRSLRPHSKSHVTAPVLSLGMPALDAADIPVADIKHLDAYEALPVALNSFESRWVIFLRAGDTVAPELPLILMRREYEGCDFVYWDEIVGSRGQELTKLKPPGAPFITQLHFDVAGRGWAVRVNPRVRNAFSRHSLFEALGEIVLDSFKTPGRCLHIADCLSCRGGPDHVLPLEAANRVLAACDFAFGRPSLREEAEGVVLTVDESVEPRVTVVMPTIGARNRVIRCIEDLRFKTDYQNLEIIVVDHVPYNYEHLKLKNRLRELADIVVPMIGPFNWSRFNNIGAALASGDILLFLNDDLEVINRDWLRRLLPYMCLTRVGAVGPRLLTDSGTVQSCGVSLIAGRQGARNDFAHTGSDALIADGINLVPHNCTALLGAAVMVRRELFEWLGGFDEALPLTFNDLDFHMRLRAHGLDVVVVPGSDLIHYEKTSRFSLEEKALEEVYWERWRRSHLMGDSYLHPKRETTSGLYKPVKEPVEVVWNHGVVSPRSDIERILVLRMDHIGDFALAIPGMNLLRTTFPNARIDIVVGPWNAALASQLDMFEHVLAFNLYAEKSGDGRKLDNASAQTDFSNLLKGEHYDLSIDLRMDRDTRRLLMAVESRYRAGFSEGMLHPWLDISVEYEGNLRHWHKVLGSADTTLRLINAVASAFPEQPVIDVDYWKKTNGSSVKISNNMIVIHPFAGNAIKSWVTRNWEDLVALLLEDQFEVVIIGAARDAEGDVEFVDRLASAGAKVIVGEKSLVQLVELLRTAVCFVGCDSGPKHLAAAAGIPVVALQSGFVDPVMWGPMNISGVSLTSRVTCAPCYIDKAELCPRQVACMTQLGVAPVYQMVRRLAAVGKHLH